MRRTMAAFVLTLACALPAAAQDTPRSGHEQAAADLVRLLRLEEQLKTSMAAALGAAADNSPAASKLGEVMTAFYDEFLPWSVLEPEYVRIYSEVLTEAELRELIVFYRSPIGQRLIETTPQLMVATTTMTQRVMAPHMPELQRRMMRAMTGGGAAAPRNE